MKYFAISTVALAKPCDENPGKMLVASAGGGLVESAIRVDMDAFLKVSAEIDEQSLPDEFDELQPHERKLVASEAMLSKEIANTHSFTDSKVYDNLDGSEQALLLKELAAMRTLADILRARISRIE